MTNEQKLRAMADNLRDMIRIERRYRMAKIHIEADVEIDIPATDITSLKQRFAALWTELKQTGNSIEP
jgi:hypothetical protein